MRAARALALVLVVPALAAAPADPAAASDETCHGQQATLVGTPGQELHGTDGDDVIVTNGATWTAAGAGNDVVCITGGAGQDHSDVDGEEGDDLVDASASESDGTFAALGPGDDTYSGRDGPDQVDASDPWDTPRGQGSDRVDTGAGPDLVATGGGPRIPDRDDVDLGPGPDTVWVQGPVDPDHLIDGGGGRDELELDRISLRRPLELDNDAGEATAEGVTVMRWSGFERFRLSPIGDWAAPAFVGGSADERLWSAIPLTSIDLGAGDDRLNLELQGRRQVDDVSYAGGPGDDRFTLYSGAGDQARRARLDLPAERLSFAIHDEVVHARISGFELHRLSAEHLRVTGTGAADELDWNACHGSIDLGAGDDVARAISIPDVGCGYPVSTADVPVRGGPGDDRLTGGREPDVLLGGPGDDVADGRRAVDRCAAEVVRRCET